MLHSFLMKNMPRFSLGLLLALAAVQQWVLSVGAEDDLTFEEFAKKYKKISKRHRKTLQATRI